MLIVVDRNLDLCPLFSHSWIYQSLVYDCLGMSLNKVTLTVPLDKESPEKGKKEQIYDITSSDSFWKGMWPMYEPCVNYTLTSHNCSKRC